MSFSILLLQGDHTNTRSRQANGTDMEDEATIRREKKQEKQNDRGGNANN